MNINHRTYETFPVRLRRLIDESGDTISVFAAKIGKGQPAVSKYISGLSVPSPDVLIRIADCLGITLDYLLCRKSEVLTLQSHKDNIYIYEKMEFDFNMLTEEYDRYLASVLGSGTLERSSAQTVFFITILTTIHLRDTVNVFKNRHGFPDDECRAYLKRSEDLNRLVNYFMYKLPHDVIFSFSPDAEISVYKLDMKGSIKNLIRLFKRRGEKLDDMILDNLLLTLEHSADGFFSG
jgi:transcriptional regulator with XRE-family HTH domain